LSDVEEGMARLQQAIESKLLRQCIGARTGCLTFLALLLALPLPSSTFWHVRVYDSMRSLYPSPLAPCDDCHTKAHALCCEHDLGLAMSWIQFFLHSLAPVLDSSPESFKQLQWTLDVFIGARLSQAHFFFFGVQPYEEFAFALVGW
jgi:hypothetical protein